MADLLSQGAKDAQPHETVPDKTATSASASQTHPPHTAVEDDSDPDLDDLDDVLDQFSANAPHHAPIPAAAASQPAAPTPSSSGPGRPAITGKSEPHLDTSDIPIPEGPAADESEEEFMARLTKEMSSIMSKMAEDPSISSEATPEDIAKMGKELEDFTYKMEAEGIKPEDLLRAIMGEEMGGQLTETLNQEKERQTHTTNSISDIPKPSTTKTKSKSPSAKKSTPTTGNTSFEDTIRRTMARMEDSSAKATTTATQSTENPLSGEEDLISEMLKALESGAAGGSGSDNPSADELSKMFLGMMEQLTNKDMLYEPMKELSDQFPKWLQDNQPPKISRDEHDRYQRQNEIVKEIVAKFEERSYSDDDPKCREFVWEKMQKMQAEGAPPEELVANPMGMGLGMPGMGGGGGDESIEGMEQGCPTQ